MTIINAKDHEAFIRSLGDALFDVEYVTVDDEGTTIEWHGAEGRDENHSYKMIRIKESNDAIVWTRDANIHRDGDLPAIVQNNYRAWYRNNDYHRESDLPSIIYEDGTMLWHNNGRFHRDNDMPAIIRPNGDICLKQKEWWMNGKFIRSE